MGRADGVDSGTTTVLRDLAATFRSFALSLAAAASAFCQAPPIIDVHLHAQPVTAFGPIGIKACPGNVAKTWPPADPRSSSVSPDSLEECPNPIYAAKTDGEVFEATRRLLEKFNITGVLSGQGDFVRRWKSALGDHVIPAIFVTRPGDVAVDRLRSLIENKAVQVIGEALLQYSGLSPADPSFDPYWAKSLGRSKTNGYEERMPRGAVEPWSRGSTFAWCCPISASEAGSQPVSGQRRGSCASREAVRRGWKRDCRNRSSGPVAKKASLPTQRGCPQRGRPPLENDGRPYDELACSAPPAARMVRSFCRAEKR